MALVIVASIAPLTQSVEDAIAEISAALDGRGGDAVVLAETAATRHPDNSQVLLWLGHAYRRSGELTAATGAYRRAAALEPDHPEILMGLAALREVVGDHATALQLYERVTVVAPRFAAAWRSAGESHMQSGNHARAASFFESYLALSPSDRDAHYLYGVSLYFGGRHDDAIRSLEAAIGRFPDLVSVKYALGVVLADRPANADRALDLLRTSANEGFEVIEARYLIGRIHADRGEYELAVEAFEQTISADAEHRDAHYRLATALSRLGRRDEAAPLMARFNELQQAFNATEAYDKQLKTAKNELAAALRANDGIAANSAVDRMLSLAPDDPEVLVAAAKVWVSSGRTEDAFDALEAASQVAPQNWEANYLYGLLLTQAGRYGDAVAPLRRSLTANPLFPETHVVVGNILMELGAPAEAVASYLAAIDLEADNPGYWLNLGAAYGAAGRPDLQRRAQTEYERLLTAQEPNR